LFFFHQTYPWKKIPAQEKSLLYRMNLTFELFSLPKNHIEQTDYIRSWMGEDGQQTVDILLALEINELEEEFNKLKIFWKKHMKTFGASFHDDLIMSQLLNGKEIIISLSTKLKEKRYNKTAPFDINKLIIESPYFEFEKIQYLFDYKNEWDSIIQPEEDELHFVMLHSKFSLYPMLDSLTDYDREQWLLREIRERLSKIILFVINSYQYEITYSKVIKENLNQKPEGLLLIYKLINEFAIEKSELKKAFTR